MPDYRQSQMRTLGWLLFVVSGLNFGRAFWVGVTYSPDLHILDMNRVYIMLAVSFCTGLIGLGLGCQRSGPHT